jgi:hypothetical protein
MGGPEKQAIYRSSDGGGHFDEVGSINLKPASVPGCDPNEWIIYGSGATAADGTLYLGARLCQQFAVAVSGDEGATWGVHTVPNTALRPIDTRTITTITSNENVLVTEPLATDREGNLYAVWVDADDMLRLATSQDKALTWSPPLAIRAPGLTSVRYGSVTVHAKGAIAIAYYGTRDGVRYDGYVAESLNALDAEPVFWSSTVNDPADPLFSQGFDSGYLSLLSGGDLVEIVQVKYAPNGDIWAAFVKDMCPGAGTSPVDCVDWDPSAHGASGFQGVVGRLVHQH